MIRSITGVGAGNGPFMSIHDGFIGLNRWTNFLPGSDRIALDSHPYIAFNQRPNTEPIATGLGANAGGTWPAQACEWGPDMNTSQTNFGFTYAGEFSNAFNDCGTFVHGVGQYSTPPTYGGDCGDWTDSSGWNATAKAGIQAFAMASMDALQNWFFWTWKVRFIIFASSNDSLYRANGVIAIRLATRLQVMLKHHCGPTSSALRTAGCLPTPVKPSAHVRRQALQLPNSTAPTFPGKLAERAQAPYRLMLLRYTVHGHLLLSTDCLPRPMSRYSPCTHLPVPW